MYSVYCVIMKPHGHDRYIFIFQTSATKYDSECSFWEFAEEDMNGYVISVLSSVDVCPVYWTGP